MPVSYKRKNSMKKSKSSKGSKSSKLSKRVKTRKSTKTKKRLMRKSKNGSVVRKMRGGVDPIDMTSEEKMQTFINLIMQNININEIIKIFNIKLSKNSLKFKKQYAELKAQKTPPEEIVNKLAPIIHEFFFPSIMSGVGFHSRIKYMVPQQNDPPPYNYFNSPKYTHNGTLHKPTLYKRNPPPGYYNGEPNYPSPNISHTE